MARAIASRMVAKLSAKCRSGRARLRVVFQRPSGRGGEMPHTFGDDERVAAEDDRDVMMPAGKPTAFVVVEAELVVEILVRAFDPPALHHTAHQLFLRRTTRQRAEETVRGGVLVVTPFDQQPHGFTLVDAALSVVVGQIGRAHV